MRRFLNLRASLVPYIYSNARVAYDEGLSLLRPLYYLFPETPEAYSFDHQYMFGGDLLVAPVTQAIDPTSGLVSKDIWIPQVPENVIGKPKQMDSNFFLNCEVQATHTCGNVSSPPPPPQGSYISWFSGERLTGPQVVTRTFTLPEMPVYAREGSIIPLRTDDFCKPHPLSP